MAAKAPDSPYSVTSPKRESTTKFKATWKRAGTANSGDKAYSKQIANWNVSTSRLQNGKWTKDAKDTTIGRPSIDKSATQHTAIINRNEYFPVKNVRLLSLHFAVQGVNDKGDAFSPWSHLTFKVPKAPSCTFDYDSGTGELKINMTIPSDNVADRYDCVYKVTRKDKKTTSSRYKDGKAHLALNQAGKAIKGTTKKSKLTVKTEVETVALGDGSSITFTVTMTARGFAGSTTTTKTFTIASPLRAHIRNVDLGNYDLISIVKNLNKGAFNKGLVRVFYRSDEGKPNAAYDTENPNEYILQRLVSPYECDTAAKANLQSGWVDVDTNAGSTSESASKYKKRVKLYSDPKLQKSDKVQYWTCTEYEAVSSGSIQEERVVGTKTVAAWKVAAMKKKKISVNGKSYSRYRNWTKASKKKVYFYKAYDKKTKQWIKNVAPWNLATKKATKYTVNGKEVKRYKSWAKDGAARNVKYYTCVNQKTGKTVKNIPAWSLDGYQNKTYTPINNPADGVMGEPIIDVLADMGFTPSGSVYDKRVWYRVKTTRFGISEYSEAYQAKALSASKPTASKDYAGFMRIIQNPLESGTSIIGTVGWNNKKNTDEGVDNPLWQSAVWTTLILWSQHKNALRSNEQPSSFPIDWKNSSKHHALRQKEYAQAVADGTFGTNISGYSARDPVPWKKSANFTIYGLEPGVPVYLWTRRHMVLDSYDEDGPVSSAPTEPKGFFPFTPIDNPTSVAVYLPEYYIVGDDLTVSWGHNAVCPQKSYNIYIVPAEPGYAKKHYAPGKTNVAKMPKKLLVAGTGTNNSVTIPGSVIERQLGNKGCVFYKNVEVDGVTSKHKVAFSVIRKLGIVVGVSTGGEEIYSCQDTKGKYVEFDPPTIVHKPTFAMFVPPSYSSPKDRVIVMFSNTDNISAVVSVYAEQDTTLHLPDGDHIQSTDECVWNHTVQFSAFKEDGGLLSEAQKREGTVSYYLSRYKYASVIKIPTNFKDLYDGGVYRVEGHAINNINTSVVSDTVVRYVECNYQHQPSRPGLLSRIEGELDRSYIQKSTSKSYNSELTVKDAALTVPPTAYIYCAKPDNGYINSDRCNVWRITPDGGDLIAEDVPFERIVIDRYAPFSKSAITRYAIATVTRPGDMHIVEVTYSLKRHGIRFDWGSIDNERSVELPFDLELDESYDKRYRHDSYMDGTSAAHFNPGVDKNESVKTKLIKLENPVQFELVKELAQYPGTVFFRSYDGSAYECICEVTGLSSSYDSQTAPVSFELKRVTLSDRFKPMAQDVVTQM